MKKKLLGQRFTFDPLLRPCNIGKIHNFPFDVGLYLVEIGGKDVEPFL